MNQQTQEMLDALAGADKVPIGIDNEWKLAGDDRNIREYRLDGPGQIWLREAYGRLCKLIRDKDYYVVTIMMDKVVYGTGFDSGRVVAPCRNIHWRQCSAMYTKDTWEEGKVPGGICPYCGAPLAGNTLEMGRHIEEGYLPRQEAYKGWQTGTPNRNLVALELGEGFKTPAMIG